MRKYFIVLLTLLSIVVTAQAGVSFGGSDPVDKPGQAIGGTSILSADVLKLQSGRYVFYKFIKGDSKKPTLVLLPGINRGFPEDYESVKALSKKGYSILITATSSHWQSLQFLAANERAFFDQNSKMSSADFYTEVEALIKSLKIENPVMLSLSYSSALAIESDRVRVFTAPLIKSSDSDPVSAKQAALWEANLALNIFLGPTLIRQFRDYGYKTHWSQVVNANLSVNSSAYGNVQNKDLVIDGYCSLSRSLEGFDLSKMSFKSGRANLFILGEKESQVRLRGQAETILNAVKKGPTEVIIIRNAEHNVPDSQPVAFVTALEEELTLASSNTLTGGLKVGVIDPAKDSQKITWLTKEKTEKLFKAILSYSDSTESADLSSEL